MKVSSALFGIALVLLLVLATAQLSEDLLVDRLHLLRPRGIVVEAPAELLLRDTLRLEELIVVLLRWHGRAMIHNELMIDAGFDQCSLQEKVPEPITLQYIT